jgi:predicted O-methyltransferase YrrM
MKDHPFDPLNLLEFSSSSPYQNIDKQYLDLKRELEALRGKYNFPAVTSDVGSFLQFLSSIKSPQNIFEMGSGYGHSAFWYLLGSAESIEKIYLTEKRTDLIKEFNDLSWPANWRDKLDYYQGDAFKQFDELDCKFDLILIDGVKAHYLSFLEKCLAKLNPGGVVIVDNSYWRGSFLDKDVRIKKQTAQSIFDLHEWIKSNDNIVASFIPFVDGISLISNK